jgi:hypothetical protein
VLWYLLFLIFVIFAQVMLFITGLAVGLLAIPFIVFFGIWVAVIWLVSMLLPAFFWLGAVLGLLLTIGAARSAYLVVERRRLSRPPVEGGPHPPRQDF